MDRLRKPRVHLAGGMEAWKAGKEEHKAHILHISDNVKMWDLKWRKERIKKARKDGRGTWRRWKAKAEG